ncbi:hypothetical protein HY251_03195, partial [bacterium]|nr:hypothetical protein [bacterium]
RAASELASRLARAEPKDDDAWACVRSCAEALLSKGERAAARELLGSLEKPLADASPDAQARLQETARRAASEPRKPESEPDKPASPHPGAGP